MNCIYMQLCSIRMYTDQNTKGHLKQDMKYQVNNFKQSKNETEKNIRFFIVNFLGR